MEINDTLNILNLTQAEITALGTVDAGTIVYNSTTNALETYNGTAWVASGGGAGGYEPYISETLIWMHQVLTPTNFSASTVITTNLTEIEGTPMMFEQDVNLNKIVTNSWSTQSNNTGHIGVYEFINKSTQGGIEYYQFDLLQKLTPTFVFNAAGVQELTLSPAYTMLAGKVYVVAFLLENTGSVTTQQIAGRYRTSASRFLGTEYRSLRTNTTQAYNPFTNNLPTSMPSSLYFYPESNYNLALEVISLKIQNA
jgi:hypothetical protein